MNLKEFMKKWKVSERGIIEAAKLTSSICGSFACKNCPFDSNYGCLTGKVAADVNIGEEVKKRIKKLLNPNHMDKVAEILGVKLGEKFTVRFGEYIDSQREFDADCYLDDDGVHIVGQDRTQLVLLEKLLNGKAYIEKGRGE